MQASVPIGRRIANNRRFTASNTLELDGNLSDRVAMVILDGSGDDTVVAVDDVGALVLLVRVRE